MAVDFSGYVLQGLHAGFHLLLGEFLLLLELEAALDDALDDDGGGEVVLGLELEVDALGLGDLVGVGFVREEGDRGGATAHKVHAKGGEEVVRHVVRAADDDFVDVLEGEEVEDSLHGVHDGIVPSHAPVDLHVTVHTHDQIVPSPTRFTQEADVASVKQVKRTGRVDDLVT